MLMNIEIQINHLKNDSLQKVCLNFEPSFQTAVINLEFLEHKSSIYSQHTLKIYGKKKHL